MRKKMQRCYKATLALFLAGGMLGSLIQPVRAESLGGKATAIESSAVDLITRVLHEEDVGEVIKIQNVQEFLEFAENCSLDQWSQDKSVVLQADIYLGDVEFSPIPTFGGSFDGKGHTISGLHITDSISPAGLFGVLQEGAVVENINVSGKVAPSGENHMAGGLVGENAGQIRNCTFTGTVSGGRKIGGIAGVNDFQGEIRNCRVNGVVLGQEMTGGVVGYNLGSIFRCKNDAKINHISVEPEVSMDSLEFDLSMDITQWSDTSLLETVSDTGGIAGYSAGVIQNCDNGGTVGYPHIGYNLGGIVGRSCGYVSECRNQGEIFGRKDVGGIVGQMDPYIAVELTESGIAQIQSEINTLENKLESTKDHGDQTSASVKRRIQKLQDSSREIQKLLENMRAEAFGQVTGADNPEQLTELIPNKQVTELQVQLQLLQRQLQLLTGESVSGATTLVKDIQDITKQADRLSETVDRVMEEAENLALSDFVTDISLESLREATYGKTADCVNHGQVEADRNVGGIVGTMSMETAVDPEDDLTAEISLKERQQYRLTTIAFQNVNRGDVIAKKDYAGGVCGRMDLGLIANGENYGSITSQNGDYVGGIAGLTGSTVQDSFAKCTLSGLHYVGGIVGTGVKEDASGANSQVIRCYGMVDILECRQFYGAIAGANIGQYEACYFVSEDLPGINHISYAGKAEPITYEELLDVEGLPEEFETFTLRFMANGQLVTAVTFEYGASLEEEDLPEVPTLGGLPGQWETVELKALKKDMVINAVYELPLFTLASEEKRSDGRAVFLAEGQFTEDSKLKLLQGTQHFDQAAELGLWEKLHSAKVAEQWRITLPKDGLLVHTLRYLPEDQDTELLELYIGQDGHWNKVPKDEAGSYLLFDIAGTSAEIAVVVGTNKWQLGLAVTVLIILMIVGGVWMIRKKKDFWKWLAGILGILLLLCAAALAAMLWGGQSGARIRSMYNGAKLYQILQNYSEQSEQAMKLELTTAQGEDEYRLEAEIFCTRLEGQQVVCLESAGAKFYYSKGILYLENGNAYQIGQLPIGVMDKLEQAIGLDITAKETESSKSYQITLSDRLEEHLLGEMTFELAGKKLQITDLTAEILAKEDGREKVPEYIALSAEGKVLEDKEEKINVEAELTIVQPKNMRVEIPDSVKEAILSEDTRIQAVLTSDILRLYRAWEDLYDREPLAAQISLSADCGPLKLEEELLLLSVMADQTRINCIQKDDFSVFFDEDTICSEKGYGVTNKRAETVKAADLLGLAYELCVQGDFRCISVEDSYIYSIALEEAGMAEIAALIAKDSADMPIQFENGSIQLMVQDHKLQSLRFSCDGEVDILLTKVPVALSAEFDVQNEEQYAGFRVPEKVLEKLTEE